MKKGCVTEAEAARHRTCTGAVFVDAPVTACDLPAPDELCEAGEAATLSAPAWLLLSLFGV